MKTFKAALTDLLMGKLWIQWRSGIEAAVVPGSGGVVFLGDSLTHSARLDLMFPGLPTRNFGISGERSDQLLTRLGPIISLKPGKLFLLIGSNDLSRGRTIEQIGADVARILDELGGALPGCKLHLQTVMPRESKFFARIKALNAVYAGIAAQRGIPLIDLFPLFDDGTGKIRQDVTNDNLHLLGSGYAMWREVLAPYLLEG